MEFEWDSKEEMGDISYSYLLESDIEKSESLSLSLSSDPDPLNLNLSRDDILAFKLAELIFVTFLN